MMEKLCSKCGKIEEFTPFGGWCKKCTNLYNLKYKKENPEYNANNYKENRERCKEMHKNWTKNNPEKVKVSDHKYRSRRLEAEGSYTTKEWTDLLSDYGKKCVYSSISQCGGRISADHIVPLTGGGTNNIDNLVPAYEHHNKSKRNTPLLIWLRKKLNIG